MANDITVAWAMPVDAAYLGARMESHVESKATVTAFRLCVQHARIGSPLGKLPHELVEMIATRIQDALFRKRLRKWQQSIECCAGDCIPSDHFSRQQLQEMMRDDVFMDSNDDDDYGIAEDEHEEAIEEFLEKVEDKPLVGRTQTFEKCMKVFMQDFGLEAYFLAFHEYDRESRWSTPYTTICAYLILPSMQSNLKMTCGPGVVSYMSSMIIDPSILQEPSPERKARFRTAMRTLQLEPRLLRAQLTRTWPTSKGTNYITSDAVTDAEADAETAALEASEWPKLMVLGSGTCDAEPEDD